MNSYFDILKRVCILAHEELPLSFSNNNAPYAEIKEYIKIIVDEICSKYNWTFREKIYSMQTESNKKEYSLPEMILFSNILKSGVKIINNTAPLEFIHHSDLDKTIESKGQPLKYSIFGNKFILTPVPDGVYTIEIKYLTSFFGLDNEEITAKQNLENDTDKTIIPDKWLHVIEWGAYALYRQNFRPDQKYTFAKARYDSYLQTMIQQDGYSKDFTPSMKFWNR